MNIKFFFITPIISLIAFLIYILIMPEENTYKSIVKEKKEIDPIHYKKEIEIIEIKETKERDHKPIVQKGEESYLSPQQTLSMQDKLDFEEVKPKVIFNSKSKSGKYIIKLLSKQTIKESYKQWVNYIALKGIIEEDNNKDKFSISVKESYKNHLDTELTIEITTLNNNTTLQCDGYFLKDLDINTLYTLKIDIYEENISCYIDNEENLPKLPMIDELKFEVKKDNVPKEMLEKIEHFEKMKQLK